MSVARMVVELPDSYSRWQWHVDLPQGGRVGGSTASQHEAIRAGAKALDAPMPDRPVSRCRLCPALAANGVQVITQFGTATLCAPHLRDWLDWKPGALEDSVASIVIALRESFRYSA